MAEKWTIVEKPFEREIVREVEFGIFAKNGKELVANVTSHEDAKLIAAAPQMLEALKKALTLLRYKVGDNETIENQISAAIAAAEGE